MWPIVAFSAFFLVVDSSSAQNAYGLKRPSYCSTCFSNDQSQNYQCCFYFFRCCAESRLGSNTRKPTTPSPEYPGFHTTTWSWKGPVNTTAQDHLQPTLSGGTNTKNFREPDTGDKKIGEPIRPKTAPPEDVEGNPVVPERWDNSNHRYQNNFRGPIAERIPVTRYTSAPDRRRYPYNRNRGYLGRPPPRNAQKATPEDWSDLSLNTPSNESRFNETLESFLDSTNGEDQQNGGLNTTEKADDVVWGRMEPVNEN